MLAGALARVGCERALWSAATRGMDELSVMSANTMVEVGAGVVGDPVYSTPETVARQAWTGRGLAGGDPQANAVIIRRMLSGRRVHRRDVVMLNAGAALYVAGAVPSIGDGVARPQESIDSGPQVLVCATHWPP